ncbi:hypothetical protein ACGIJE_03790 [Corynebacterium hesseae]|uniref:hypothetical protein n=1 Tax=Corynebacterium hesseae TaxID=2913502 RepID=UPI0038348884
MARAAGQHKSVEESLTFAKGVSLLAGHDMDAEQEVLVCAVASGDMTVEEAIAIAREQVK